MIILEKAPNTSFEVTELEEVFFANPHRYGFFGKKLSAEVTGFIPRNDVAKISASSPGTLK